MRKVVAGRLYTGVLALITANPAVAFASDVKRAGYYTYSRPVIIAPKLAKIRGQNFSASAKGIQDLCSTHADLCELPDVQLRVTTLKTHRTVAYSLYGAAGASFSGGLGYGLYRGLSGRKYGDVAIYTGLALSVVLAISGAVVAPKGSDYEGVLDMAKSHQLTGSGDWHTNSVSDDGHGLMAFYASFDF